MTELDQVEEAIHTFFNAARAALEVGVNEVDLCWGLEGVIDTWELEIHNEMERANDARFVYDALGGGDTRQ